jgi:protocatechuate 3,4-dioxygenase beta subunit
MAGSAFAGCVVRPAQTEGVLNRSEVQSDPTDGIVKPGAPLELTFRGSRLADGACVLLTGAVVDIWQCDADGVYSGVVDPSFDTTGRKYLRGLQTMD